MSGSRRAPVDPAGTDPSRSDAHNLQAKIADAVVRIKAHPRAPLVGLFLVSVASLISRVRWIGLPTRANVGDETSYINVARSILGIPLPSGTPQLFTYRAGFDPNNVHPPLAKALMAGSMKIFGDGPVGWRLPSILFGSAAILALYWLVRSAKGSAWLALGAASLLAADNLFLIFGRIGTIDVFALPFMLAGTALYLRRHPIAAGVVIGIGTCTKLVGVFPLVVLVFLEAFRWAAGRFRTDAEPTRPWLASLLPPLRTLALCGVVTIATYLGVLAALDSQFSTFRNPVSHTSHMIGFHRKYVPKLDREPSASGYFLVQPSKPLEWLANQKSTTFFILNAPDGRHITFRGEMNPVIIWLLLPSLIWSAYIGIKRRDELSFLCLAWFLGTFLPFLIVAKDVGYLYYMIVVLPGICLAVARFIGSSLLPQWMLAIFFVVMAYSAWQLYPFHLGRL